MQFDLLGKAVRRFRLPAVDYVNAPVVIVPVQQGDVNTRFFEISLYDDQGDIDLNRYSKALLYGTTPSGVVLSSNQCEIKEDGSAVIVQFGGGFAARTGRVACDIQFINQENTASLTSQTFYVIVSESQSGKIIAENDGDFNELLKLLRDLTSLENKIENEEAARVISEQNRTASENDRVDAENIRNQSEAQRITQENTRQSNEQERQSKEEERQAEETFRIETENARIASESARAKVEQIRTEAESARVEAEAIRQTNEETRSSAETQRIASETARVVAETKRENDFKTAKTNCETATKSANDAAQSVQDLLDELPCPTNKVDGETKDPIVELNFVALGS